MKEVKFSTFCGKTQEFAVLSEIREFCESSDVRKKYTALVIVGSCCGF